MARKTITKSAAAHTAGLVGGYLLAWAGFGVLAYGLSRALGTLAPMTGPGPMDMGTAPATHDNVDDQMVPVPSTPYRSTNATSLHSVATTDPVK